MRHSSFQALKPVCPACRARASLDIPVELATIESDDGDAILAGILQCRGCGGEFPIIDGIPVLVPDVRRYVEDNLFYLMARTDLTPAVESLLGDASGASSGLQSIRQHVSSYVWDHWGDHDPEEGGSAAGAAQPGSIARAFGQGFELLSTSLPDGPAIDVGCGPGRFASEIAARTGRLVVAADLSVPLARAARQALGHGVVEYPRRRVGMVYDRRRFSIAAPASDHVEVWLCDALNLPFAEATFALATSMNLLDCVADPHAALVEMGRVLRIDGEALIALPFDWTDRVTPTDRWLGGHSQRGPHAGRAEDILDGLLGDGPMSIGSLRSSGRNLDVPWHVRLHDRSCMHYTCRVLVARRTASSAGGREAG